MDFQEAMRELDAGKKIRRKSWDKSIVLFYCDFMKEIQCLHSGLTLFRYDLEVFRTTGWFIKEGDDEKKELTFPEAMKAVFSGKKVFHRAWIPGEHIFCSENKKEIYKDRLETFSFLPTHECLNANDWEIFE